MIEKVEKTAIKLRFIFLALFIVFSIVAAVCYANEKEEDTGPSCILSFWPPDMVPHLPPHFPQPQPKPNEPVMG